MMRDSETLAGAPAIAAQIPNEDSANEELEAERNEIARIFDYAYMPCLEKADLVLRYFDITKQLNSGQDFQNSGPGRPGIISRMARELSVPGKTEGERRKWLERALTIAELSPKIRQKAKASGLARHPATLLEIANAQSVKIDEIAAHRRDHRSRATAQKCATSRIRYPVSRKDAVLAALTTFVEKNEVELLP